MPFARRVILPRLSAPLLAGALAAAWAVATPLRAEPASTAVASPVASNWTEAKWPFPMDQWGLGRAFACPAHACGAPLRLYLRAKIGFCDCARGVADDAEVDRVADVEIITGDYVAAGSGRAITVGAMPGRSRLYEMSMARGREPVLAIAFAANCNVAIATVAGTPALPDGALEAALTFLNSPAVLRWAEAKLAP